MKKPRFVPPNYLDQAIGMANLSPGIHHITVEHDDWCALLNGKGSCNCSPVVCRGTPDNKILKDE